jgi:hypothetical protein
MKVTISRLIRKYFFHECVIQLDIFRKLHVIVRFMLLHLLFVMIFIIIIIIIIDMIQAKKDK